MFSRLFSTRDDWALTVIRLALGVVFLAHGAQKLLGWFGGPGYSGTMQMFSQMGIPGFLAVFAIAAEFFGGLGLIMGFLGRIAALGIAVNMMVAIAMVHLQFGLFMNWTGKQPGEGFEFHLLAIAMGLGVLISGSGPLSIDRALNRWLSFRELQAHRERPAA
jgi:putative oxidoreductase